jgi:hypothetical protein
MQCKKGSQVSRQVRKHECCTVGAWHGQCVPAHQDLQEAMHEGKAGQQASTQAKERSKAIQKVLIDRFVKDRLVSSYA